MFHATLKYIFKAAFLYYIPWLSPISCYIIHASRELSNYGQSCKLAKPNPNHENHSRKHPHPHPPINHTRHPHRRHHLLTTMIKILASGYYDTLADKFILLKEGETVHKCLHQYTAPLKSKEGKGIWCHRPQQTSPFFVEDGNYQKL